ncbi:MAG: septum site-determining protein MinD [Lachnospiraceae bacterium]|nr:septum site-determining protein MinD [Lachnospiraceae bacterium]
MSVVIAVTSGKGGVGKTTICANLGYALAISGTKTIVADLDTGLRNLDLHMGTDIQVIYNLMDLAEERCEAEQAMVAIKEVPGLFMVAAAQTRTKSALTKTKLSVALDKLRPLADVILLDCPAGIDNGFLEAAGLADRALVITSPDRTSVRDADRVIGILEAEQMHSIDLVINMVQKKLIRKQACMSTDEIEETLHANLIGVLPMELKIAQDNNLGKFTSRSKHGTGKTFRKIAQFILKDVNNDPRENASEKEPEKDKEKDKK